MNDTRWEVSIGLFTGYIYIFCSFFLRYIVSGQFVAFVPLWSETKESWKKAINAFLGNV
jgi:hypothetical protein